MNTGGWGKELNRKRKRRSGKRTRTGENKTGGQSGEGRIEGMNKRKRGKELKRKSMGIRGKEGLVEETSRNKVEEDE